jgi:peptidyl-prolyl cis-trans isomerase SurA
VRHILLTVKPSPIDIEKAVTQLDSIARSIRNDSITFEKAAAKFSDDPGKNNNGLMINPYTNNTEFQMDQLDPQVSFVVDKLEIGEVSTPFPMKTEDGLDAYRIMCVKSRTEPHRANLADDYDLIQQWAMADKKQQKMKGWVNKNIQNAYVMIIDDYKDYNFNYDWFQEQK